MPFYYEELTEEGYTWGGYPLSVRSENGTVGSESQFAILPTLEEYSQWIQPEFVSPSEVELNPRIPPPQPPPSKFSLPPAFLQAQSANAPQIPSAEGRLHNEKQGQSRTNPRLSTKDTSAGSTSSKGKQTEVVSLDEFWLQNGKAWERVEPTPKETTMFIKRSGMGACMTGPECFVCGTKLSLDELMNPGTPCRVCSVFN